MTDIICNKKEKERKKRNHGRSPRAMYKLCSKNDFKIGIPVPLTTEENETHIDVN